MFTDNTRCGRIMIGLSFSSVSKYNIWSYYDWVYCCFRSSVNIIYGRIMIGLSLLLCLLSEDNDNPIIIRPHIVLTDKRQRQPNHNTTTYCVYPSVNIICGGIMVGFVVVVCQ
jgi:hypothetical protein